MIKQKSQQLYDILHEELRRGAWPRNSKMPSLKELSEQYGVSINVVNKTVEMLKSSGLVRAKSGDGIYSETSGQAEAVTIRCSGKRIFGKYRGAKLLRVIVEDHLDWQTVFWRDFFDGFVSANPDIELQINYNVALENSKFDVAIGSVSFLSQNGLPPEKLYPAALLEEFYPGRYENMRFAPSDLSWQGMTPYLPYGMLKINFLSNVHTPEPVLGEGILDYLERLYTLSNGKLRYWLFSGLHFLSEAGLKFIEPESGTLKPPAREELMNVFRRVRKLYQSGSLIWEHGEFTDYEQLYGMDMLQPFQLVALPGNRKTMVKNNDDPVRRGLKLFAMPEDHRQSIYPLVFGIARHCIFPEEALRMIVKLLESETQHVMERIGIAQSILEIHSEKQPHIMQPPASGYNFLMVPEQRLNDLFHYFINWEFYYYLNGRRGDEVYDFICSKLKWGQENKQGR